MSEPDKNKPLLEINLLPEQLRPKKSGSRSVSSKDMTIFIFIGAGLLVAINIIIIVVSLGLGLNVSSLENRLKKVDPDIQKMRELEAQLRQFQGESQLTQEIISKRILWAEKMQIISDVAPQGVWLKSMSAKPASFTIDGTCVALNGKEMSIIGEFINGLKDNKRFFSGFDKLELRSVQRRMIGSIEVVEFILMGSMEQ